MATTAEIALLLTAQDRMTKEVARVQKQLSVFQKTVKSTQGAFKGMTTAGRQITAVFGVGAGGVAGLALKTGISFNVLEENAQLAFETMIKGSQQAGVGMQDMVPAGVQAAGLLSDIKALALKQPFKLTELIPATQRLLAFGFAAKDVPGMLTDIADAAAGLGGSPELLERVALAFGQMMSKGKVSGEEILQLAEAGIPAWKYLAQNIGMLGPQFQKMQAAISAGTLPLDKAIQQVQKLAEAGKLPAAAAIAAIRKGTAQQFGGLGERQAKSTAGQFSNLVDALDQLAGAVGKPAFRDAAQILKNMADAVTGLQKTWDDLPEGVKNALSWIATFVAAIGVGSALWGALTLLGGAAGLGGLGAAFGAVAGVIGGVVVGALALLLTPLGLVVLAVAALALAWATNFLGIRDTTAWVVDAVGQILADGWAYVVRLFSWLTATVGTILAAGWAHVVALVAWLADTVGPIVSAAWTGVVAWFQWLVESARFWIRTGWAQITLLFANLSDATWAIVSQLAEGVAAWFTWLVESATGIVGDGWAAITGLFSALWGTAVDATAGLARGVVAWWEWLVATIKWIWAPIGDFIAGVLDAARRIPFVNVGGSTPTGMNTGTSGAQAPIQFAEGGMTRADGLAYLHAGEVITPYDRVGAGRGVTVTVTGPIYGFANFEDAVVRALDKARQHGAVI